MTDGRLPREQMSDKTLMLRVRLGDELAFEHMYRRYHVKLQDFFYGMVRHTEMAEDLCQETFARVWRIRHKYDATGSVAAYLFAIARNIWLEQCRTFRKDQKLGTRYVFTDDWPYIIASRHRDPDEIAVRSEMKQHILDAIERLPDEQRMVFVLRSIRGLSTDEIAEIMRCPANTVRSRRILAVNKLRKMLRGLLVI